MKNEIDQESTDEIDLGELLLGFIRIINKNKLHLALALILGLITGIAYFNIKKPVFESTMMLSSNILTTEYSVRLAQNLKKLIEDGNHALLGEKLNISKEKASNLVDIRVDNIKETNTSETVESIVFIVTVEVTDNSILTDLETGVIHFLENNEFVKARVDLKRKRLESLIAQVRIERMEMDTLKRKVGEGVIYNKKGGNLVLLDPTTVYSRAQKLYKEELNYKEALELIDSIQLIEGFTAFEKPIGPKLLLSIGVGLLAGLFLVIGLIFIKETRAYLKSVDQE